MHYPYIQSKPIVSYPILYQPSHYIVLLYRMFDNLSFPTLPYSTMSFLLISLPILSPKLSYLLLHLIIFFSILSYFGLNAFSPLASPARVPPTVISSLCLSTLLNAVRSLTGYINCLKFVCPNKRSLPT